MGTNNSNKWPFPIATLKYQRVSGIVLVVVESLSDAEPACDHTHFAAPQKTATLEAPREMSGQCEAPKVH